MNKVFDFAKERLFERSTWFGIGLVLTGFGVHLDPKHFKQIIELSSELLGLFLILSKDKK